MDSAVSGEMTENIRWIATSTYKIRGRKTQVTVRLAEPVPDDGPYKCLYEITGLKQGDIADRVFGADGIQSLYLAMQIVSKRLEISDEYKAGKFGVKPDGELHLPRFSFAEDK